MLVSVGTSGPRQAPACTHRTGGKAPSSVHWRLLLSAPGEGERSAADAFAQLQACNAGAEAGGLAWGVLRLGFPLRRELQARTSPSKQH